MSELESFNSVPPEKLLIILMTKITFAEYQ